MLPLAMLRARWASFAGTFVTLTLGVGLIAATALVFASAVPQVPDRLAGAAVVVRAPQTGQDAENFPEFRPWSAGAARDLAGRLAAVPGVAAAVPDRTFYAQVVTGGRPLGDPDPLDPQGHGWASTALGPLGLVAGRAPAREGEVAVDAALGLVPGARVDVLTAAGPAAHTVTGTVAGPGVYLADPVAERLSPGVTVLGLRLAPGADEAAVAARVRAAVGPGVAVLAGGERSALEPELAARTRWIGAQLLIAMVTLGCFAAVFVVASTAAFSVVQRRRDLALLRASGATPGQVRRLVVAETLLLGAVAGALGAVLGAAVAPWLGGLLVEAGLEPAGFAVDVTAGPLLGAVAAGLVVALLGVLSAARRAARVRPVEALRDAEAERRPMTRARWVCGAALLAGGAALTAAGAAADADRTMNLALLAAMAFMVALALLAPALLPPLIRLLAWPFTLTRGAGGQLVREGSVAAVRRTAATAAPVLLTVGFATLITGMVGTMAGALAVDQAREAGAEVVVVPSGTPGLSDAAVRAVGSAATAAGGSAVSALEATVLTGDRAMGGLGVDAASLAHLARRATVESGALSPRGAAVAAWLARELGWRAGTTVPLTFADGRVAPVPLTAVYADGTVPADLVLPRDTVRAHDPSALTSRVYVAGASAADLRPALAGAAGARVLDVAAYARTADAEEDRLVRIFVLALIGLACGYTGIAIANTLLVATAGRLRDLAVLRLAGATRRQVLAMVAGESALVVALGTLLGGAVAGVALLGVRAGLSEFVDAPVALVLDWPAVGLVCGACLALALAASVLPAALALRSGPARYAAAE